VRPDSTSATERERHVTEAGNSDGEAAGAPETPARDAQLLERTVLEVKRVIVGQDRLVERLLVGLLAKGHLLLEGVPGVAKTLAVETFARVVGGSFSRVQFTPDLVPADILGTRDRKSTRLNSSHVSISYAVFCLKKKNKRDLKIKYVGQH